MSRKPQKSGSVERDIRLQIMLLPVELAAIEKWRFAKHMPSRASAVRELLRRGLAAEGFDIAPEGKFSANYGVMEPEIKKRVAE